MKTNLVKKYNIPGPRYTSYPTVPYWDESGIQIEKWTSDVVGAFQRTNQTEGISLYIHLPYCESLCTFCGCRKHITKNHEVEEPYITTVLKEWDLYCDLFSERPRIQDIHLGGGTPTFFSMKNLERLISGILKRAEKTETFEFSFEGHPNNTTKEHLKGLFDLGFRRNSFGVQDYDPKVQKAIHRIQPFENVKRVTEWSREVGYTSVGHDIIFGLPLQTKASIIDTIEKTKMLAPDRIAYYSYAHVPWIKGTGQRGYSEDDLPKNEEKRALYEYGKQAFLDLGYVEIGMDHFALKTDSLYLAMEQKTLHRNFMGYTAGKTELMIGLGMSSIGDAWTSFAQNLKTVKKYTKKVENNEFPLLRGHALNEEDLVLRKHILDIMCHFETSFEDPDRRFPELSDSLLRLSELEKDGLVKIFENGLIVPEEGRAYIRNICMAFDLRLIRNKPQTRVFSSTI